MSETKETTDKTLSVTPRKPLSLKRTVDAGHVRQSFSHGRSKSVVVEKKKKRTISGSGEGEDGGASLQPSAEHAASQPGGLSTDEMDARRRALEIERERAEAAAREAAALEAQRAREEAARPKPEPAPQAEVEATAATPTAEAPAAPESIIAKKPPPPKGPVVVVPSADKPKTDLRRTETVAKRKLDVEPGEGDEESRGKKKG